MAHHMESVDGHRKNSCKNSVSVHVACLAGGEEEKAKRRRRRKKSTPIRMGPVVSCLIALHHPSINIEEREHCRPEWLQKTSSPEPTCSVLTPATDLPQVPFAQKCLAFFTVFHYPSPPLLSFPVQLDGLSCAFATTSVFFFVLGIPPAWKIQVRRIFEDARASEVSNWTQKVY